MPYQDTDYYRRRADEERAMAKAAASAQASAVHSRMAERYEALSDENATPIFTLPASAARDG